MPLSRYVLRHEFHPVGQGLFCSGILEDTVTKGAANRVTWVHDCGAQGRPRRALKREVDRFRKQLGDRRVLDVLILSHFDQDHLSGLKQLLPGLRVRWLVLPYLTLEERMLMATDAEELHRELYLRFLYRPAQVLNDLAGPEGGIETVVFVGGDEEMDQRTTDPVFKPTEQVGREGDQTDLPMRIAGDWSVIEEDLADHGRANSTDALHVESGTPLICGNHWEFIFHNKPARQVDLGLLRSDIRSELKAYNRGTRGLPETVERIRKVYRAHEHFGTSAIGRNDISLVTYAGPHTKKDFWIDPKQNRCAHRLIPAHQTADWTELEATAQLDNRTCGLLYTGDITMTPHLKAALMETSLRGVWSRISTLQVPHHGADRSWLIEDVTGWSHRYSVVSYGTANLFGHPGQDPLSTLRKNGPILVNEFQAFLSLCSFDVSLNFSRLIRKVAAEISSTSKGYTRRGTVD